MGGIGKTTLAAKLAQQVQGEFEYVIWRSLRESPPLDRILSDWIKFLSNQQEIDLPKTTSEKITRLLDLAKASRCLLILDNAESILQSGTCVAKYRSGYEGYGELLQRIGESNHQSCFVLTSREPFKEVRRLAGNTLPVRVWELAGLNSEAKTILAQRGLNGSEAELNQLIRHYRGNPLALQIVPETIAKLYSGSISQFLASGTTVFREIDEVLAEQFDRLSANEQSVMYWLAINREGVSSSQLQEEIVPRLSEWEILETLDSLACRSLVHRSQEGFTLQNVVMEYVSKRFVCSIVRELQNLDLQLFKTHPLLKATAKEYIRETQKRLILEPIAAHFYKIEGNRNLERRCLHILETLRQEYSIPNVGYAGGNLLNLLVQLQTNLSDRDFSHLPIWQGDFRGATLQNVNFSHCDLAKSVFSQSLGSILTVAFSPDGQHLATGGTDGQIRIWQVEDGRQILAWEAHENWIRSVAFSADGGRIASGSNDRTVKVWDTRTGECQKVLRGHTDWVWSVSFLVGRNFLVSASGDRTAKVWNIWTGLNLLTFREPEKNVWSAAFSKNGYTLATSSETSVKLWNAWTGKCDRILENNASRVRSLAFSPDSKTLVGSNDRQTIQQWDVATGEPLATLNAPGKQPIWSLQFNPEQKLIAGSTETIQVWDVTEGECQTTLQEPHHRIRSLTCSRDGQTIAIGSDDQLVRLWDVKTGQPLQTLQGYANRIWSLAVCRTRVGQNGAVCLASGSDDGRIRLWDANRGKCIGTLRGHRGRVRSLAFSPDGEILASASHDRTLKLWDITTGECVRTLAGHADWVVSVAFANRRTLISAGDDQTVLVWDLFSQTSRPLREPDNEWMWAFACQGKMLAMGGSGGTIPLMDIATGYCWGKLHGHHSRVRSLAFDSSGKIVASGGDDLTLKLWNIHTQDCLTTLSGHTGQIRSIAFVPASETRSPLFASGSDDRTVRLWDIRTGKCCLVLEGHIRPVWSVCYCRDLDILLSAGEDETIKLWDLDSGDCLETLRLPKPYDGTNISGATGLTEAQKATLKALGAIDFL